MLQMARSDASDCAARGVGCVWCCVPPLRGVFSGVEQATKRLNAQPVAATAAFAAVAGSLMKNKRVRLVLHLTARLGRAGASRAAAYPYTEDLMRRAREGRRASCAAPSAMRLRWHGCETIYAALRLS